MNCKRRRSLAFAYFFTYTNLCGMQAFFRGIINSVVIRVLLVASTDVV